MRSIHVLTVLIIAIVMAAGMGRANTTNAAPVAKPDTNAVEETGWSPKHLLIGPVEVAMGVFMPVGGIIAGCAIGALVPIKNMKSGCALLLPYTVPAGAALGATAGSLISPLFIVEGMFDSLTGGAFAKRPCDWFTIRMPMDADNILDDTTPTDTPATSPAAPLAPKQK